MEQLLVACFTNLRATEGLQESLLSPEFQLKN